MCALNGQFVNLSANGYRIGPMRAFRHSIARAGCLAAALCLGGCEQRQETAPPRSVNALEKLKAEAPKTVPPVTFADAQGKTRNLSEFRGRYVLLNLWATWCAPCVRELPSLSHLQEAMGANNLLVVPVNVGHGAAPETAAFLKENKAAALPVYLDTKSAFLHAFGALGLPLTVLIDPQGREIARASGAVQWDAKKSISYFQALTKR
ncbi:MAG: TlpA family protein disulfide reductase [Alphaproteobacteria bacterium]|nr:TlpA family protein disulfide reductase [Alphaproteobacteria bacterium]